METIMSTMMAERPLTQTATHTGSCFCGAVAIEASGEPLEAGYCHCNSCRLHSGAPLVAFTLWKSECVVIVQGKEILGGFAKTEMIYRRFCMRCAGTVMTEHAGMGCTDIPAAVLSTLRFVPTVHLNYAEAVLPVRDGLLKLNDFPSHAGGSGCIVAE
jgi:hypothetical protein